MAGEIMDIAARMKELREICDFTQEEMAAELGVPAANTPLMRAVPSTFRSLFCWQWQTPAAWSPLRC